MKIAKLIAGTGLFIVGSLHTFAQDYFIAKGDTTFCSDLKYTKNVQGYLNSIKYTDAKQQPVVIEGKQLLINVETLYQNGITIDKIPSKAHKPDGYIIYVERKVDGKLKVYLLEQKLSSGMVGVSGMTEYIGPYIFYIKMSDGTYYQINNKSNMKKYIKPYLLECPLFAKKYKGNFSNKQALFIDMIKLYNSLCE